MYYEYNTITVDLSTTQMESEITKVSFDFDSNEVEKKMLKVQGNAILLKI